MNMREFTQAVGSRSGEMGREELRAAFHSLARKVPEPRREIRRESFCARRCSIRRIRRR